MQITYGYIRVSTKEQNEDRQRIALERFGVPSNNIYLDKLSGKDFNRPQYRKVKKKLKKGDILVVTSIDRLGRDYEEIQNQWRIITKEIRADIVVLDMPLVRTQGKLGRINRNFCRRSGITNPFLCSTNRAGEYEAEANGRDCCCKTAGRTVWTSTQEVPEEFHRLKMEWEQKELLPALQPNVWEFLRIRFFDGSMEDSWEGKWATDCENLSFLFSLFMVQ